MHPIGGAYGSMKCDWHQKQEVGAADTLHMGRVEAVLEPTGI